MVFKSRRRTKNNTSRRNSRRRTKNNTSRRNSRRRTKNNTSRRNSRRRTGNKIQYGGTNSSNSNINTNTFPPWDIQKMPAKRGRSLFYCVNQRLFTKMDFWMDRKQKHIDDFKDLYGRTVLHYAVDKLDLEMINHIVKKYNADPQLKDNFGHTPLDYAVNKSSTLREEEKEYISALKGDYNKQKKDEIAAYLLKIKNDIYLNKNILTVLKELAQPRSKVESELWETSYRSEQNSN